MEHTLAPSLIGFSRNVVIVQCFTGLGKGSRRKKLPGLCARANNCDRTGLSTRSWHESFVNFTPFLPSLIHRFVSRSLARLADFVKEEKIAWPQVFDGKAWDAELAETFGIQAIPAIFLIDKEGKIAAVNLSGEALIDEIKKLLE